MSGEDRLERFEREGYLVLPDAVPSPLVAPLRDALLSAARDGTGRFRRNGRLGTDGPSVFVKDPLGLDDRLCELVDLPATIETVVELLGWNIHVYDVMAVVTPAGVGADAGSVDQPPVTSYGWHRDGGRMNREANGGARRGAPPPRLAVKVAYFLSDVSEPDRGNLRVVPGSHAWSASPRGSRSETGVPVCAPAGSAVLFDRRLWHTASPNLSDVTRVAVMIGFAHRWVQPMHDGLFRRRWRRFDPVRRQLLGEDVGNYGRFFPDEPDVPLRSWAAERGVTTPF